MQTEFRLPSLLGQHSRRERPVVAISYVSSRREDIVPNTLRAWATSMHVNAFRYVVCCIYRYITLKKLFLRALIAIIFASQTEVFICGHTAMNLPRLVRSAQTSIAGAREYCRGWPGENTVLPQVFFCRQLSLHCYQLGFFSGLPETWVRRGALETLWANTSLLPMLPMRAW